MPALSPPFLPPSRTCTPKYTVKTGDYSILRIDKIAVYGTSNFLQHRPRFYIYRFHDSYTYDRRLRLLKTKTKTKTKTKYIKARYYELTMYIQWVCPPVILLYLPVPTRFGHRPIDSEPPSRFEFAW